MTKLPRRHLGPILILIPMLLSAWTASARTGRTGSVAASSLASSPGDAPLTLSARARIAFASDRTGNFEIFVMDGDGGGQIRLTDNPGEDHSPTWSPDGKRIAFVSTRDGNSEIYVMNADGSAQTRLTSNTSDDISPSWSPDGARIAFVSNRDGDDEVYLMNADGSNQQNLTRSPFDDAGVAFSPDGQSLVISSDREDQHYNLFILALADLSVRRVTATAGDDVEPSWTGLRISFQSNRDENEEIYSVSLDGRSELRLTSAADADVDPSQAPDGASIVFSSNRDGNFEIYAMSADGSGLRRLTTNDAADIQPAVQPFPALPGPAPGNAIVQFSSGNYSAGEGDTSGALTVTRSGDLTGTVTVTYASIDGTASGRTDYVSNFGKLVFAPNETSKSIRVLVVDDVYVENDETVTVTLSGVDGGALGPLNTATLTIVDNDTARPSVNPSDNAQFFVNQHYLDFLNRVPDASGLSYWVNQIVQCGNDLACLEARRRSVSAAFFIETEFQATGFYVYRLYKGGLGVQPTRQQFVMDRSQVVGGAALEAAKAALAQDFVTRADFLARYPLTLTIEAFVNRLFDTAGLVPFTAERQQLITDMRNGKTRAQALRDVIEIKQFKDAEYNPAFVLMQYFAYLGRDADPDGYAFWLNVLNNSEPNNYLGMVCSFITSAEYQLRFSSVVTQSNAQCRK